MTAAFGWNDPHGNAMSAEAHRFRTAAAHYLRGRPPYAPALIRRVAQLTGLGRVHRVLRAADGSLPESVAALIEKGNDSAPLWQKNLLSSQLDVDRLDYLRRDSLFTGAGYGHFDWLSAAGGRPLPKPLLVNDGSRELNQSPEL